MKLEYDLKINIYKTFISNKHLDYILELENPIIIRFDRIDGDTYYELAYFIEVMIDKKTKEIENIVFLDKNRFTVIHRVLWFDEEFKEFKGIVGLNDFSLFKDYLVKEIKKLELERKLRK